MERKREEDKSGRERNKREMGKGRRRGKLEKKVLDRCSRKSGRKIRRGRETEAE